MAWHPQYPDRPPDLESPRAVAWAALFFSLIAVGLSGYVFFKTYDNGHMGEKLKTNFEELRGQTTRAIKGEPAAEPDAEPGTARAAGATKAAGAKPAAASKTAAASKPAGAPKPASDSGVRWDKIRERLGGIQEMIKNGDTGAAAKLEELKRELIALKDYSSEKGSTALQTAIEKVGEARDKLKENAPEAGQKLKSLRDALVVKEGGAPPKPAEEEEGTIKIGKQPEVERATPKPPRKAKPTATPAEEN